MGNIFGQRSALSFLVLSFCTILSTGCKTEISEDGSEPYFTKEQMKSARTVQIRDSDARRLKFENDVSENSIEPHFTKEQMEAFRDVKIDPKAIKVANERYKNLKFGSKPSSRIKPSSDFDRATLDGPTEHYSLATALLYEENYPEAVKYLKLAALYGSAAAHSKLAEWYETGQHVPVDFRQAYLHYYLLFFQLKGADEKILRKEEFDQLRARVWSNPSEGDQKWVQMEMDRHNEIFLNWARAEMKKQSEAMDKLLEQKRTD